MNDKLTWTAIAVHLAGETPASCRMTADGGMFATLLNGRAVRFSPAEVDEAIEELDALQRYPAGNTPAPGSRRRGPGDGARASSRSHR